MDTIIIACPKCHTKNKVPTPKPSREGTHVLCAHCNYVFKVVPKIRPNKTGNAAVKQAQPKVSIDEIMDSLVSLQSGKNHGSRVVSTEKKSVTPKSETQQPSISTLLSRPVAEPETASAVPPKQQQNAGTVAAPLRKTTPPPQSAAAQPSANPQTTLAATAVNSTLTNSAGGAVAEQLPAVVAPSSAQPDTAAPTKPEAAEKPATGNSTVNNLVFTLLSSQEHHQAQADVPLLLNDTIEKTENISATQQVLTEQQAKLHREFNWTLASLVALTVLIIQLFYLMAVK